MFCSCFKVNFQSVMAAARVNDDDLKESDDDSSDMTGKNSEESVYGDVNLNPVWFNTTSGLKCFPFTGATNYSNPFQRITKAS